MGDFGRRSKIVREDEWFLTVADVAQNSICNHMAIGQEVLGADNNV